MCVFSLPPRSPLSMENTKKELPKNNESAAKKQKIVTLEVRLDVVRRHLSIARTTLPPCERPVQGALTRPKEEGAGGGEGQAEDISGR